MKKSHLVIVAGLLFGATACRENEPIKPVNFKTPSASEAVVQEHEFDRDAVSTYESSDESTKIVSPTHTNQEHLRQVTSGLPEQLETRP